MPCEVVLKQGHLSTLHKARAPKCPVLGTNDLKMCFSVSAYDSANGAGVLVQIVQKSETGPGSTASQVLLLTPPPVAVGRSSSALTGFVERFEGAEAKSRRFGEHYACVAQERGRAFLDTGQMMGITADCSN
jgi:hypothetical protein